MLRVTPVYGSRFDEDGAAQSPTCTLVSFAGVRVLWNVGWWGEADGSNKMGGAPSSTDAPTLNDPFAAQAPRTSFPPLPEHDVMIVSDSTLNSLGGLPLYYETHWKPHQKRQQELHQQQQLESSDLKGAANATNTAPSTIPMYATFPTVKMGQMTLYDHHAAISLDGGRPPYTLEQMDDAFASLKTIKYSQTIMVKSTANDGSNNKTPSLSITAHQAGHVVGGAFFILKRLQDDTIVVLTPPTYNIAKELHLDSSTLLKYGATPDVLVTYPGGPAMKYICKLYHDAASNSSAGGSKTKKKVGANNNIMKAFSTRGGTTKQLIETILSVLRRDGHVLLPVDASGRVLELVLFLSQHWDRQRLGAAYNLVWLGPMCKNTLDFARSQLEWMSSQLGNQFDDSNTAVGGGSKKPKSSLSISHPYSLKNVHLCSSIQELDAVIRQNNSNPTCVLASGLDLDHGPARDLFLRWADNADHAIVFTDSSRCFSRRRQQHQQQPQSNQQQSQEIKSEQQIKEIEQPTMLMRRQSSTASTTAAAVGAAADDAEHDEDGDNENTMMVGSALGPDEQASKFCAATQLLQQWCNAKWEGREMDDSILIDARVPFRTPLAGQELKNFLAQEEAKRQYQKQQEEKRAMLREVEIAKGQLRLGEDEPITTASTMGTSAGDASKNTTSSSGAMMGRPNKKSKFDSSLFIKFSKPLHLTFEVREEAVGVGQPDSIAKYGIGETVGRSQVLEDDYGIAVKPERFKDIVSGVDPSKFVGSGRIGEDMRKGFGYSSGPGGKRGSSGIENNANEDEEGDGEDEMDEQAMEAADLSEGNGIIRGRGGRAPTKVTAVPRRVEVLAEIAYVPLEGRVIARAARQSVRALQPRQVVVMGGPAPPNRTPPEELLLDVVDEVSILVNAVQSFTTDRKSPVHSPSDGETVELNVGHSAYSARLIDTPFLTREQKQQYAENGIDPPEPVEPYEMKVGPCTVSLLKCVATGQKVALDGSIVLAPKPVTKASVRHHPSVYVSDGEVLLTDLRSELIAQGMKAEYSTQAGHSQLVVNGKILVRKGQDSRRLDIEGPLCEDFFTVRGVINGQFVTLS